MYQVRQTLTHFFFALKPPAASNTFRFFAVLVRHGVAGFSSGVVSRSSVEPIALPTILRNPLNIPVRMFACQEKDILGIIHHIHQQHRPLLHNRKLCVYLSTNHSDAFSSSFPCRAQQRPLLPNSVTDRRYVTIAAVPMLLLSLSSKRSAAVGSDRECAVELLQCVPPARSEHGPHDNGCPSVAARSPAAALVRAQR